MAVYAMLVDGVVVNTAEWDEFTPWELPATIVKVPPGKAVEAGWTWDGQELKEPVIIPPEETPIQDEEPRDLG